MGHILHVSVRYDHVQKDFYEEVRKQIYIYRYILCLEQDLY
jgi:hypothetical protein